MIARPRFGKRKFGDRAMGKAVSLDWRTELVAFLITGGTSGRSQTDITRRLANHANAPEIVEELEALFAADKVQRFSVPAMGRGRPHTVWRATTKIMENDDEGKRVSNRNARRGE